MKSSQKKTFQEWVQYELMNKESVLITNLVLKRFDTKLPNIDCSSDDDQNKSLIINSEFYEMYPTIGHTLEELYHKGYRFHFLHPSMSLKLVGIKVSNPKVFRE